jgi:hypothetical protein
MSSQYVQSKITQVVEPARTRPECSRRNPLDESQIVQQVEMSIGGGTADSRSKGKVLRSLERITQQPLE